MLLENKKILIMGVRNKWSIAYGIAKSAYENGAKLIFTYRDETEKNISIIATRTVRLHMVSPYQKGDNILSQEVITNKILNYNGVDKKVVQIKVTSGIKENLFPIKATSLEIVAPKILDKFPKTVLVSSVDNLTTNNKKLSDDMWNYNAETGTINISARK